MHATSALYLHTNQPILHPHHALQLPMLRISTYLEPATFLCSDLLGSRNVEKGNQKVANGCMARFFHSLPLTESHRRQICSKDYSQNEPKTTPSRTAEASKGDMIQNIFPANRLGSSRRYGLHHTVRELNKSREGLHGQAIEP